MMDILRQWQKKLGDKQPLTSDEPESAEIDIEFLKRKAPKKKENKI
jgi:hypothetical protein